MVLSELTVTEIVNLLTVIDSKGKGELKTVSGVDRSNEVHCSREVVTKVHSKPIRGKLTTVFNFDLLSNLAD